MSDPQKNSKQVSRYSLVFALVIFASAVVFMFWGVAEKKDHANVSSTLTFTVMPMFVLEALPGLVDKEGTSIPGFSHEDLKGHVSVINVWASWCVSCRHEHDSLMKLAQDPDMFLYGLNYKDQAEDALALLEKQGNPYRAVGVDSKGRIGQEWEIYGLPETFIVDRQGNIHYRHIGPLLSSQLEVFQKKLLEAKEL